MKWEAARRWMDPADIELIKSVKGRMKLSGKSIDYILDYLRDRRRISQKEYNNIIRHINASKGY